MGRFLIGMLLLTSLAWPGAATARNAPRQSADAATVTAGANRFGLELFGRLAGQPGNLFLSPAGLECALGMAYAGARGQTASEMSAVLGVPADSPAVHAAFGAFLDSLGGATATDAAEVRVANAMFLQNGYAIRTEYNATVTGAFRGDTASIDFADTARAAATINDWVGHRTNGKIPTLVDPGSLAPSTRLYLANALYFHGRWQSPFDTRRTKADTFRAEGGASVNADFMTATMTVPYAESDQFEVAELAYTGGAVMDIILPRSEAARPAVERALADGSLVAGLGTLRRKELKIALPRFRASSRLTLAGPLAGLGMPTAFGDAADFSGISDRERVAITSVAHKVFIDVNEEGSEAAAATGVGIGPLMYRPPRPFTVDHPCLVVIRNATTGAILFVGRLSNPAAQ
jgi:serpin B